MFYQKSITGTVYIVNNGRVLLHMHKKYKTWFPVGGHAEENEFPHETAVREAKEETGLTISIVNNEIMSDIDIGRVVRIPLPFCTYYEGVGHNEEFFDFIFIGETSDTKLNPANEESKEFRWFTLEELNSSSDIKPHVKNTAVQVLKYMLKKIPN